MSEVLSVQQKEGKLREKPSFLAKVIKKLPYGTKVNVVKKQGVWFQISLSGSKGWIHKSSLTEKVLVLKSSDKDVDSKVSDDELVLAGKGFIKEEGNNTVLSVQVKEGKLRSKPSFLGKVLKSLPYGSKVSKTGEKDKWFQVTSENISGWMHESSLTEKTIVLKAGDKNVDSGVSDDELVLAGKGFNREVEKSYNQSNPNLNYSLVDKMEQFEIDPDEYAAFVKEGGLPHV